MGKTAIMIGFVISLVVSTIIVNGAINLYMKIIGADGMFFSGKNKVIAIIIVALFLEAIVMHIFGLA